MKLMIRFKNENGIATAFLCCCLLLSCVTFQKAEKKLDSSPLESARYCSLRFPIKDSIVVRDSVRFDTIYSTDTIVYNDNSEWGLDTISQGTTLSPPPITKIVTKTIVKTVTKDSLIYRDNPNIVAKVKYLEGLNAKGELKNEQLTRGRNTYRIITFAEGVLILLIIAGLIYANTHKV